MSQSRSGKPAPHDKKVPIGGLSVRHTLEDLQDSSLRLDSPFITWIQFDRAHREATRLLEHRLAAHALTRTSVAILLTLLTSPSGVEIKRLVAVTGLMHAGMSGALNRLEREGLCARTAGKDQDQRAVIVQLTLKGRSRLMEAMIEYESWAKLFVPSDAVARHVHATTVALNKSV
jgi:DNA-binding MarR family transcriptional regulator